MGTRFACFGTDADCEPPCARTIRSWLYLREEDLLWQDGRVPLPSVVRLALVFALSLAAAHGQGAFYQLTDLGALGAPADKPAALNRAGMIVGTRTAPGRDGAMSRAFLHTNGFHELGPANTPAFASDLNEQGDIVGWSRSTSAGGRSTDRAVLWQKGRQFELGTLGGAASRAFGINDRMEVTGAAQTADGAFHAFLWRQSKLEDLGTLGGRNSYGHALNSAFDVAGVAETAQQLRHAFLHTGGKMRDLGTLGGLLSQANALNEASDVVGFAQNVAGHSRAFLYTKGKMADLGTLGGTGSFANAINNHLHVVGGAQLATGEQRAFLWQEGKMRDLNQLLPPNSGWLLLEAMDLNEAGRILCLARTKNGQLRAVLLSPPIAGKAGPAAK